MAVTDSQLKAVINTDEDTAPLINLATRIYCDVLGSEGFSGQKADSITLFLAAHLVVLRDENGGLRRSRLGESDESYVTPGDKSQGFASTRYGQMAMILDTSGKLAAMNSSAKTLRAQFKVEGSRADDACI